MADQWKDLYFRHYFGDTGIYPMAGSFSASPDIVPAGGSPFSDPTQLVTDNNWAHDYGNSASASEPNYVYLRGQNLGTAQTEGQLYLYASKASLLLYPTNPVDPSQGWSQNPISTSLGGQYVSVKPAAGARFVSMEPFRWIPAPITGDHYCLIGRVVTEANPNPIPTTGNLNDFAAYISSHPNMSWRNIALQNPANPQWSSPAIEYDQGDIGGEVTFILKCINAPDKSRVRFSSGTTGPNPPIALDWTEVKNSTGANGAPTFAAALQSFVPANWYSKIVYTWDSAGQNPLPNMSISLQAMMPNPGQTAWDKALARYARPVEELLGVRDMGHIWRPKNSAIGPTKALALGSHTMRGAVGPDGRPMRGLSAQAGRSTAEAAATSSIFVIGTSWRETTHSIIGSSVTQTDVTIERGLEKDVVTETLRIASPAVPVDDADLAVDVDLQGPTDGGETLFSLITNGVPVGATVWFKNTSGDVVIDAPPTKVSKTSNFQIAVLAVIPGSCKATIRIFVQLDGLELPSTYSIAFSAMLQQDDAVPDVDGTGVEDVGPKRGTFLGKVTIAH